MWRMYCVCLLSVIVVLDLLGQSHVNRTSHISAPFLPRLTHATLKDSRYAHSKSHSPP